MKPNRKPYLFLSLLLSSPPLRSRRRSPPLSSRRSSLPLRSRRRSPPLPSARAAALLPSARGFSLTHPALLPSARGFSLTHRRSGSRPTLGFSPLGDEVLNIPKDTWRLSKDGAGGTIIDSGTTLSYFAEHAYTTIREAFVKIIKDYPVVKDFPVLDPCYNVSGVERVELPDFSILFEDGTVWDFPAENYFIRLDPDDIICLAILGTPRSSLSILGNYQQQNFHIMYDTKMSRLGFAPMKCADV